MSKEILVHALIPARGGSKSIPKKNIRNYKGKPLLVHSINAALQSIFIQKVVVSTDCEEIQRIAQRNGAEAPFLRPSYISADDSLDIQCFQHYLSWLRFAKQDVPDIIVHLRPTYPERDPGLVDRCISQFLKVREKYTSLRSVIPTEKTPFKMYRLIDNVLIPLFEQVDDIKEPYNQTRQKLPMCYLHNGCIDIMNTKTIEEGSMTGDRIYPYLMDRSETLDIDTENDWDRSLNSRHVEKKTSRESNLDISGSESQNKKRSPPIDISQKISD